MCSGCGWCSRRESHSVGKSAAPSVGLVQVASPGSGFQTNIIPAPARVPDRTGEPSNLFPRPSSESARQ
jgi:hypothetical protein